MRRHVPLERARRQMRLDITKRCRAQVWQRLDPGRMERPWGSSGGSLTSESGRNKAASSQSPAGRPGKAAGGLAGDPFRPVWV